MEEILVQVESIKSILVAYATGNHSSDADYKTLRAELIKNQLIKKMLPGFVLSCRSLEEFWGVIKPMFDTYRERRAYIAAEFDSVLTFLEEPSQAPLDGTITETLATLDSASLHVVWQKALERRTSDPEGAITSARTLLETACKHILDEDKVTYNDTEDLPKLYGRVAKQLDLAPSHHTEKLFKQILGGCHAVVEGLGAIRNKLSDAHGKGKKGYRASPRHAALAVNLAGTVVQFLIATHKEIKVKGSK